MHQFVCSGDVVDNNVVISELFEMVNMMNLLSFEL